MSVRAAAKLLCDYTGGHVGPCEAHLRFASDHYAAASPDARHDVPGDAAGRAVHAAWRDGMLEQGREVAPERMAWETLSEQDRQLDEWIAARLAPSLEGARHPEAGETE